MRCIMTLLDTTDAQVWAQEFIKIIREKPELALDEGMMIGWFANAIEAGRIAGDKSTSSYFGSLVSGEYRGGWD